MYVSIEITLTEKSNLIRESDWVGELPVQHTQGKTHGINPSLTSRVQSLLRKSQRHIDVCTGDDGMTIPNCHIRRLPPDIINENLPRYSVSHSPTLLVCIWYCSRGHEGFRPSTHTKSATFLNIVCFKLSDNIQIKYLQNFKYKISPKCR